MKHAPPLSKILSPFQPLFLAHHDDIIIGCHIEGDLKKYSHDDFHDLNTLEVMVVTPGTWGRGPAMEIHGRSIQVPLSH